jgi:hypothetical protein
MGLWPDCILSGRAAKVDAGCWARSGKRESRKTRADFFIWILVSVSTTPAVKLKEY